MKNYKFTKWSNWFNRNDLRGIDNPGVYCIAISNIDLSGQIFNYISEIKYVGMSNALKGLKGRLNQFNNTILDKKNNHGGADRFRFKYVNYQDLVSKLFVSICSFNCDVKSFTPNDLRIMGKVTKLEYDCLANYVEKFKCLPEFNDKKKSPKYSKLPAK